MFKIQCVRVLVFSSYPDRKSVIVYEFELMSFCIGNKKLLLIENTIQTKIYLSSIYR